MTNLEILRHLIGSIVRIKDERLIAALTLKGLSPSDTYSVENACKIYGLAISEAKLIKGVSKITEGGYSIEYSDPGDQAAIFQLAKDSGCPELIAENTNKPTLKYIGNRW